MDENYKTIYIPQNFENGINVFGMNFRTRFIVEGIVVGALTTISAFLLFKNSFGIGNFGQLIGYSIAIGGVFTFLGIKGINDEPLSSFLANMLSFAKKKRTTYYNPRVKKEAVSYTDERSSKGGQEEAIPRERILAIIDGLKEKYPAASSDADMFDPSLMQFADDKLLEDTLREQEKEDKKSRKKAKNEAED